MDHEVLSPEQAAEVAEWWRMAFEVGDTYVPSLCTSKYRESRKGAAWGIFPRLVPLDSFNAGLGLVQAGETLGTVSPSPT